MKNIIKFGVPIILLLGIYISGIYLFDSPSDVVVGLYNGDKKEIDTSNTLAIMYENDNGEYVESTSSNWLGDGYTFNATLSKCKNGSKIYYDSATNKVMVEANTNDRCYVYFDILNFRNTCIKDNSNTFACKIATTYTTDGENGLYYHDGVGTYTNAGQEAGDNSYRYSGADPNNYVCFGSDATKCRDEYLYRIIGVFDDDGDGEYNVKLIKADYTTSAMLGTDGRDYDGNYNSNTSYYKGNMDTSTIASYKWNYDTSVHNYGSNDWTTSELNKTNLNTNYIDYLESSWNSMIEDATWYLGGMTSPTNTAKSFYTGERNNAGYGSNPTTYGPENANGSSTKIGLMYPSDYGYAAYSDAWKTNLSSYFSNTIKENNWLYMGLHEWTITANSSYSFHVFSLGVDSGLSSSAAMLADSVRPVFYLKSNISYVSGDGTKASPFRIN